MTRPRLMGVASTFVPHLAHGHPYKIVIPGGETTLRGDTGLERGRFRRPVVLCHCANNGST
ncbi:MAG: hypothetical protein IPL78_33830 [Chloroflexi bacterium]|nr:hypothetical protein [Chloroflexota bacterium]